MAIVHDKISRPQKAIILLVLDGFLTLLALLAALQLRLGEWWPDQYFAQGWGLFLALPLIGMALAWVMGVPHIMLRSFEHQALLRLGRYALLMAVICALLNTGLGFGLPRSIPGIWAALFLMFAVAARLGLLGILNAMQRHRGGQKPVVIYGAGAAGQQLMAALKSSPDMRPVAFIDDNPLLRKIEVAGMRTYPAAALPDLIARRGVQQVILAMPSIDQDARRRILADLRAQPVKVLTLPSFMEMLDGRALGEKLRPVTPDDLLGRQSVDLRGPEITAAYAGKSIMITGAGGSIGSELTRQILQAKPARLVLYEQSEIALYTIDMEVRANAPAGIEIVAILGSVGDAGRLASVLKQYAVQIVLHAGAYKHVPLVEGNAVEGARNNILGTQVLADAALAAGVERFILISTDKAVRPTNVMGATKRFAEMVIQDRQTRASGTIFTMVRFGNVLGSSGSVIPLFRRQIDAGGPVTLTHPDVTRFFMTIPEAAQLVLLAGSFAEGGEVFVLDMGKAMRIADLARSLIELSGFSVRDAANPTGDIEITTTGLRPGEKLYEELLIGEKTVATPHPKIMRAMEGKLGPDELSVALNELGAAIARGDEPALRRILKSSVDGYMDGQPG